MNSVSASPNVNIDPTQAHKRASGFQRPNNKAAEEEKAPKVNFSQNEVQKRETKYKVDAVNTELKSRGIKHKQTLDQADFLKLLVTQLKHQDPLSPMNDREFIAQMAQFSSLEQLQNVNKSIGKLANQVSETNNVGLLSKNVTWYNKLTGKMSQGQVHSIDKMKGKIKLNVGGSLVDPKDLVKVEARSPIKMDERN